MCHNWTKRLKISRKVSKVTVIWWRTCWRSFECWPAGGWWRGTIVLWHVIQHLALVWVRPLTARSMVVFASIDERLPKRDEATVGYHRGHSWDLCIIFFFCTSFPPQTQLYEALVHGIFRFGFHCSLGWIHSWSKAWRETNSHTIFTYFHCLKV